MEVHRLPPDTERWWYFRRGEVRAGQQAIHIDYVDCLRGVTQNEGRLSAVRTVVLLALVSVM